MTEEPLGWSLPSDWHWQPLRLVTTKIGSGATPRGGSSVYTTSGTALIRSQNVQDHRFDPSGLAHLDDAAAQALHGVTVQPEDVLLNITGDSILRCCMVPASVLPARVSQHVAILRTNDKLKPVLLQKFLTLPAMKAFMLGHSAGGTRKAVTKGHLEGFLVPVPPPAEQSSMASFFVALDDKIESNRRKISACHKLAESLCQSILGSPTERWTDAWPDGRLEDVLSVLEVGRRPAGGIKPEPQGIPSIGAESIVQAGSFDFNKTKRVSKAFFAGMRRGRLEHLDVLLYKDGGTPGNFIPHVSAVGHGFPFSVASINEHVYRLRINPPYTQSFLYWWLSSPRLIAEMKRRGTGAAIPGLNSTAVRDLPVPQLPIHVLSNLQEVLDPLLDLILRSAKESRACAQLRDALLPELLSGRMRMPEAREAADQALG